MICWSETVYVWLCSRLLTKCVSAKLDVISCRKFTSVSVSFLSQRRAKALVRFGYNNRSVSCQKTSRFGFKCLFCSSWSLIQVVWLELQSPLLACSNPKNGPRSPSLTKLMLQGEVEHHNMKMQESRTCWRTGCVPIQGLHPLEDNYVTTPREGRPSSLLQMLLLFPLFGGCTFTILRSLPYLKTKKEREKMATSSGADGHVRRPGRQKSWRKGKTSNQEMLHRLDRHI